MDAQFRSNRLFGAIIIAFFSLLAVWSFRRTDGFGWAWLDLTLALLLVTITVPEWLTPHKATEKKASKQNQFLKVLTANVAGILVALAIGEVAIRLIDPQSFRMPRFQASLLYGHALSPSTTIIAKTPGRWGFIYTTNEYGHRIPTVPISNHYDLPNIVALGDSYTFGEGVNDGEEYVSVIRARMQGKANIVNLGIGGYGLTQEIRKYYEFGQLYHPAIVTLAFCENDPGENIMFPITSLDNNRFTFSPTPAEIWKIRSRVQYLSDSIIQYSQIYNMLRGELWEIFNRHFTRRDALTNDPSNSRDVQSTYNRLLEGFADDMRQRGIKLLFFAVNDDLGQYPDILKKVHALHDEGKIIYVPTEPWFAGKSGYESLEGHKWGAEGHRIVGEHLAPVLMEILAQTRTSPP